MSKAVLVIMDGFGIAPASEYNAISVAKTPNLDKLFAENAYTQLSASGLDVGLPEGQMGNSEVGHTNIGAGRVVFQDLPKITKSIKDGDFFENPAYVSAMDAAKNGGKALHIRQAVGLHFPKGGEAMRITFHIGEFTITIIVKKR